MPAGKTSSPAGISATCEAALLLGMAAEIHLSGILTYGADLDPLNRHIAARHAAFGIRASVFQTADLHVEEADVLAACRSGMLTEIVRIHIVDSFDISLVRTPDDVLVYFSCGGMSSPMTISSSKTLVMNSAKASRETAWRPPVDTFELFAGTADVVVHDMPDIFAANGGHRLTRLAENKTVLLAISGVSLLSRLQKSGFS